MIRFFDEISSAIEESFIFIAPVLKLDAASITDYVLNTLETLGLGYKSPLIGLGFDWASVMRGQWSGVQKRIHDKAPFLYYVHFYGDRLNLVLINATKHILSAAKFFSLPENLYIFVSNPVVHGKFSWNTTRNVFQRTSPRAATYQWYTMVVSGCFIRKCSVTARSHKALGGDICE